jgi:hypothetical protein
MGLLSKAVILRTTLPHPKAAQPAAAGIRTFLDNYQQSSLSFHCVVLKALAGNSVARDTAAAMVVHFGSAYSLPGGKCLVCVPGDMDRELLIHRLSKSMNAVALSQFKTESAAEAAQALTPYL